MSHGGGEGSKQQGFHVFAGRERRITPLLHFLPLLWGRNQMHTLITLSMSEGANAALSADYGWEDSGVEEY